MTISIFGAVAALLLLAIPFYAFYALGIKFSRKLLMAVCRMLISLAFVGGIAEIAIMTDHILVTIIISLLIILMTTWIVVLRSKCKQRALFLPTFCGIAIAVVLTSVFFIWIVISSPYKLAPSVIISIVGLTAGGCVMPLSEAIAVYYSGLRNHAQLYNLLIGNGATRNEALNYLLKRATEKASIPSIKNMGGTMICSQPLLMWTMLALKVPIGTAVAWQATMTIAIMSASIASVMISLLLVRRSSTDDYSRINTAID